MLSRETWRSSFGIVGDRLLFGVGHATALHSGRPRDILCGNQRYPRGRRLVLYDAEGDFDRNFDWWKESSKHRLVEPQLPFENGRSDLLTGSGSRLDIENINLLATLLVHAQYQGYWNQLGMQFQEEMEALLQRH